MSETELYLEIYHYPLGKNKIEKYYDEWRVKRAFYFRPRIFRAGGTTKEALEKVIAFIEEKLSKTEIEAEVDIEVEIDTELTLEELEMKGSVSLISEHKIKLSELRELYSRIYSKIKQLYYGTEPRIMIKFLRPIRIPLTKEDYRILFEELLNTNAQLNVETAKKLFGKEFAKKVSEHNRQIRGAKKN